MFFFALSRWVLFSLARAQSRTLSVVASSSSFSARFWCFRVPWQSLKPLCTCCSCEFCFSRIPINPKLRFEVCFWHRDKTKKRKRENGNLLAVWRCFAFAHVKKRFGNNDCDGFVCCLQVVKHKKKKKQERHWRRRRRRRKESWLSLLLQLLVVFGCFFCGSSRL